MYPRRDRAIAILALAVTLASTGCGDSPAAPTPPPPAQLTLTCPGSQTAVSFQGQPATVSYPAPTSTGGTAPVQTTCTPASGSAFGVGTTSVSCRATGSAAGETASCSFAVTVTRPPQLSVSRFMAFGDSITYGTKSDPASLFVLPPPPSYSYPSQLQALIGSRYTDQAIVMVNEGWPGEMIDDGRKRLTSALSADAPDVVLLLEGANDLLNSPSTGTTQYIASKLREMVQTSKAYVRAPDRVLLANFPPEFVGTPPNRGAGWAYVPGLNQQIASVAASEGATLVDLYTPMSADVKRYIGMDGLHPTEQGFTVMAETFARLIQDKFETKPGAR